MGGVGADQLYGGVGNDVFRFQAGDANFTPMATDDVIYDFDSGDRLQMPDGTMLNVKTMKSITMSGKSMSQALSAAQIAFPNNGGAPLLVQGTTDSFVFWSTDSNPATFEQGVMLKGLSAGVIAKF
jgi:hypothetical protein